MIDQCGMCSDFFVYMVLDTQKNPNNHSTAWGWGWGLVSLVWVSWEVGSKLEMEM